jgi:hypothetical protein
VIGTKQCRILGHACIACRRKNEISAEMARLDALTERPEIDFTHGMIRHGRCMLHKAERPQRRHIRLVYLSHWVAANGFPFHCCTRYMRLRASTPNFASSIWHQVRISSRSGRGQRVKCWNNSARAMLHMAEHVLTGRTRAWSSCELGAQHYNQCTSSRERLQCGQRLHVHGCS